MNEKEPNVEEDWRLKALYRQWFQLCRVFILFYSEGQTAEAVTRLHSSLFHLLVMFSNEKSIMNVQVGELICQLKLAEPAVHVEPLLRNMPSPLTSCCGLLSSAGTNSVIKSGFRICS